MAKLREIKTNFEKLSDNQKEQLIGEIYKFSKDMQLFLEGQLLKANIGEQFIKAMKKETVDKVYNYRRTPGTPNGRIVNSIITKAKRSNIDVETLIKLEKLAFEGFIDFLNEYGGGPETFEYQAIKHMETYLKLIKKQYKGKCADIFVNLKNYLQEKDNMYRGEIDEIFEQITGIKVKR